MGSAVSVSPKVPAADDTALAALTKTELQRVMAARGVGRPDVPLIHERVFRVAPLACSVWSYLGHDNMPTARDEYVRVTTMPGAPTSDYPLLECCSDGLSDLVAPDKMLRLCIKDNLFDGVGALIEAALDQGGKDNITAILVEPEEVLKSEVVAARAKAMENLFLFEDQVLSHQDHSKIQFYVQQTTLYLYN